MFSPMAAADDKLHGTGELPRQNAGLSRSWESDLTPVQHSLKFLKTLKEQYVCPICQGVVLNPHQSGCGHIFCYHCIQGLMDRPLSVSPICPLDRVVIKPAEVFQDNCCKREISNLEVYCTNSTKCPSTMTLCCLQEHLKACRYESVQCSNTGCMEVVQRKDLQDHLNNTCQYRMEPCRHCKRPYILSQIKEHEKNACPEVEVDCPNKCFQRVKRCMLIDHNNLCPEVQIDCVYKRYGCPIQGKRAQVEVHEDTALNQHVLLILGNNTKLEKQIEDLQQELLLRQQEIKEESLMVSGLEREVRPLAQQASRCDQTLSAVQRTLNEQRDHISSVRLQLQELSCVLGPSTVQKEVGQLRASLDTLRQQVSAAEGLKDHLGALEENFKRHSGLLDIHTAQLSSNKERFQELESTSYDGKLIWKIRDFRKWKEAGAKGQEPCLSSVSFHTGRCGYKMAAKAYLNGDGEGRGNHLSLYIVLMRGDFDPLLPWPFRQTVSLSVLDQSGASNHLTLSFRPDPTCNSFQRPGKDSATNIATGFSRFISHAHLEAPKNAVYVKDDTLFVKVKVDTTGLDDL